MRIAQAGPRGGMILSDLGARLLGYDRATREELRQEKVIP
jgi:hypothetical protein